MSETSYKDALPVGAKIESYEIQYVLGAGGFGITYKAYDKSLDREVAIKEFLPQGLAYREQDGTTLMPRSESDVEFFKYGLDRFLSEARTLAKFHDPGIVRINRFISAHKTAYMVMDYEKGITLSEKLKAEVNIDEEAVLAILLPVLQGLKMVHAHDYLHRDIKPSNIFLRETGTPLLIDFGAARQAMVNNQTQALTTMVTPGYAPFEQYHTTNKQGPWTDIYGLGATAYHCIVGFAPAAAPERISALLDKEKDPVAIVMEQCRKRFSPELIDCIELMMQCYAKDRPQNVDEVFEALGSFSGELRRLKTGTIQQTSELAKNNEDDSKEISTDDKKKKGWTSELLKSVEINLEYLIGPLSRSLVRKAATKTDNVDELTSMLTQFIPSEEDKTSFLGKTQLIRERFNATPEQSEKQKPLRQIVDTATRIDPQIMEAATNQLKKLTDLDAQSIVTRIARQSPGSGYFIKRLAMEVRDRDKRQAFLKAMEN